MSFPLVTTHWLQQHLNDNKLVLLDASMSAVIGRKPIEYQALTLIPGSRKLDLESVMSDVVSSTVHAFPTEAQFTREAQRLGIATDSTVVIYDNQGIYSSPRGWWVFQSMGFSNAFVLDGGLPKWMAEQRPTVSRYASETIRPGNLLGHYQPGLVCDSKHIVDNFENDRVTVLDARSKERFLGKAAEPRPGIRSGHIPGSLNLPFPEVLDGNCYKTVEQLKEVFSAFADRNSQLIFSCGSGITACIILLAARIAGYKSTSLYDGSWSDWGSDSSLPISPPD